MTLVPVLTAGMASVSTTPAEHTRPGKFQEKDLPKTGSSRVPGRFLTCAGADPQQVLARQQRRDPQTGGFVLPDDGVGA